ncbi:hypothetical protein FHG87_024233, partial [Trinorchestia longiramus]
VERQAEDAPSNEWQIIGSTITRDTRDLDLCDFPPRQQHFLKMSAMSEAGTTTVLYRVMPGHLQTALESDSSGLVQEIPLSSSDSSGNYLEVPVIAGCISALLLIAAVIICVGAVLSKQKFNFRNNSTASGGRVSIDTKEKSMDGIYSTGDCKHIPDLKFHNDDFNTASKKKLKRGSIASLSSRNDASSFEIYPYATFGTTTRLDHTSFKHGEDPSNGTQGPHDCVDPAVRVEWPQAGDVYHSGDADPYGKTLAPGGQAPSQTPGGTEDEQWNASPRGKGKERSIKGSAGPSTLRHQDPQNELMKFQDVHQQRSMQPLPGAGQQHQLHQAPEQIYQSHQRTHQHKYHNRQGKKLNLEKKLPSNNHNF